ncbi:DegT/DnrJ/EryC1/StrS family aminotransferase [Bacteroidota bacterium]
MSSKATYDVAEQLIVGTLRSAVMKHGSEQVASAIKHYLLETGIAGKNILFFNFGRNALYSLFKQKFSGERVIFPAFICPTLVWAAVRAGVIPHFVDVSLEDFNMDIGLVSDKDIETSKALFLNHTFGIPADMDEIRARLTGRTYIIEDVAQALFARYRDKCVGTLGDSVLVSMYKQTPNINGAILLTDSKLSEPSKSSLRAGDLARLLWLTSGPHDYMVRLLRQRRSISGQAGEVQRVEDTRQPSALALRLFEEHLHGLKGLVDGKRAIAHYYRQRVEVSQYLIPQQVGTDKEPSWFNFSVRLVPEIAHIRDNLLATLRRRGIFCDHLWHDAPVAADVFKDYLTGDYPNASLLAKSVINLPINADYREADVDYLFDYIEGAIKRLV